jgi:hypothetical protein
VIKFIKASACEVDLAALALLKALNASPTSSLQMNGRMIGDTYLDKVARQGEFRLHYSSPLFQNFYTPN